MNGNANLNANNLTPKNITEWREKLGIGIWIWNNQQKTLATTVTGSFATIDLGTYLPSFGNGEQYEVLLRVYIYNTTSSAVTSTMDLYTDVLTTSFQVLNVKSQSSRQYSGVNVFIVPTNRYIYYKVGTVDGCEIKMLGYKRVI